MSLIWTHALTSCSPKGCTVLWSGESFHSLNIPGAPGKDSSRGKPAQATQALCSWLSGPSSGQRGPFLPVSPYLPPQSERTIAVPSMGTGVYVSSVGNGLWDTWERWLPGANVSSNSKTICPRAFLLLISEWHQGKKRCLCSVYRNCTDRCRRAHLSSNQSLVNRRSTSACSALLLKLLHEVCSYLITRGSYQWMLLEKC